MTDEETMLVFGIEREEDSLDEARRGLGQFAKDVAHRVSKVTVSTLQKNMQRFLQNVDFILTTSPKEIGGLTLDEIEIHAQIDSKGSIGLASVVGAEVTLQGGIKFVLRKKVPKLDTE